MKFRKTLLQAPITITIVLITWLGCQNKEADKVEQHKPDKDTLLIEVLPSLKLFDTIWNNKKLVISLTAPETLEVSLNEEKKSIKIGNIDWEYQKEFPPYIGVLGTGQQIELRKNMLLLDDVCIIVFSGILQTLTPVVLCEKDNHLTLSPILLNPSFQPDFILVDAATNRLILNSRYAADLSTPKEVINIFTMDDCIPVHTVVDKVVDKQASHSDTGNEEDWYISRLKWLKKVGIR